MSRRREDTNIDHEFFAIVADDDETGTDQPGPLTITLRKPNTQNWGYDVPILGSENEILRCWAVYAPTKW